MTMLSEIVVVGENPNVHACLNQAFSGRNYGLLSLRDVPAAIPYLRDPGCMAQVALFCNVTMRREQDFTVLSEISAIHPHLQILLLPENARSLPSVLPAINRNIRMIQRSASWEGTVEAVQHAAKTAAILTAKAEQENELADDPHGDNSPV